VYVKLSTYETLGTALVADFANFTELSLRRGIEFQVTNSHASFFIQGQLAIRADFRCAFIVYRPKAVCTVTGL
jgi:capsid protein